MSPRHRQRGLLDSVSGVISVGLVLSLLGGALLMGDVTLGAISLRQSDFFGAVTLLAGLLSILAGVLRALRISREMRQRRQ